MSREKKKAFMLYGIMIAVTGVLLTLAIFAPGKGMF